MAVARQRRALRGGRTPGRSLVSATVVIATLACGGEPAALEVGPVTYTRDEVWALSPERREKLELVTALGVVTAERRIEEAVRPAVEDSIRALVLERRALERAADEAGLDRADLERLYRAAPEFRLTVRHILASAERWREADVRAAALERARAAHARLAAGEPFDRVAAAVSEEPGAATRGGQLEPGRRGAWVDEFWDAAVILDVGAVSEPVETEYGWHVIEVMRRDTVPMDSVRWQLLSRIPAVRARLSEARGQVSRTPATLPPVGYVTEVEQTAIAASLRERLAGLAERLGFRTDTDAGTIREAALAAHGDTRQSARIAIEELGAWSDGLRAAVPITRAAGVGD